MRKVAAVAALLLACGGEAGDAGGPDGTSAPEPAPDVVGASVDAEDVPIDDEAPEPWPPRTCDEVPPPAPAATGPSWSGDTPFDVETVELGAHVSSECALVEDLDRDGALDLVVALEHEDLSGELRVLWNIEASGPATAETAIPFPEDYNPTNDFLVRSDVHCLVGAGDGTFSPAPAGVCPNVEDTNAGNIWAASAPDLDHDGAPDVLLARTYTHNALFLSGGGALADATEASVDRVVDIQR